MPFLVALAGVFVTLTTTILGRVLFALGLGLVTYTGFAVLLSSIIAELKSSFSGLPGDVLGFLAWLWVDKAISVIIAAVNTDLAMRLAGNMSGSVRKWMVTRPSAL